MNANLNFDLKAYQAKLLGLLQGLRQYVVFIFILAILGAYSFLVYRINTLTLIEPSDDAVTEKLLGVKRPKVDEGALTILQNLEDQNIEVQTLFEQARNNPFEEQ